MIGYHSTPVCLLCGARPGIIAANLCQHCARAMAAESHTGPLAADAAAKDACTYKALAEAIVEGCAPTARGLGGSA